MNDSATQPVRVKICGITRPEDGVAAARAGADAIGLVFYPPSPRHVTVEQARAVLAVLPPFVTTVGLFVNADETEVRATLEAVPLDLLQFHGDESPEYCRGFGRPYMKALRMREGLDVNAEAERYHDAQALLLDAYHPAAPGGTGEAFDWERVPGDCPLPIVLAGGLAPENVVDAVRVARPYAVDLSSGVEAGKGIKDPARIQALMTQLRVTPY